MILLFLSRLFADPWTRPEHPRVVMQEPHSWKELEANKYAHRFWWDKTEEKAEIQWLSPKGWKTIRKKVSVGWISSPYPIGSRFRIRFPSSTRWSEVLQADPWLSPFDLVKLQENQPKCTSRITSLAKTNNTLWGGSIDGGLYSISAQGSLREMGTWEGIWDDRIISLAGNNDTLLIGSAGGAVLFQNEEIVQSWQSEFSSPYIQAVSIQEDDLWIGSFRGLYRIRGGFFETKFRQDSVFSIAPFLPGETLVGHNGIQYFLRSDEQEHFPNWGNIYDIAVSHDYQKLWLSSSTLGVMEIHQQNITKKYAETPNALYVDSNGLWMADSKGLYHPQQGWQGQFGEVFDLLEYNGNLWFSSETGIYEWGNHAKPIFACTAVSFPKNASLVLEKNGITLFSEKSFAIGQSTVKEWTKSTKGWHPISISGSWKDIATEDSRIWTLDEEGVWLHTAERSKAQLLYKKSGLTEIAISSLSIWGRTKADELIRLTLGKQEMYDIPPVSSMSAQKKHICVGTKKGLFRIFTNSKENIEKWYTNTHFPAVYGAEDGICWFASSEGQVGWIDKEGNIQKWETPSRIGTIYTIQPQEKIGLWVYTSKGLWLLRMREV